MANSNDQKRIPEKTISIADSVALLDGGVAIIVGNLYRLKGTLDCASLELKEIYEKNKQKSSSQ